MKKTSINLLSALVILFLTVAMLLPVVKVLYSFIGTYTGANSLQNERILQSATPMEVNFYPEPDMIDNPTVELTFDNGDIHPAVVQQAVVIVPQQESFFWTSLAEICIYAIAVVIYALMIIDLIKFIININRGKIFVRASVTRLRRLGLYLLVIGFLELSAGLIEDYTVTNCGLTMAGVGLGANWEMPWSIFLLGLMALLLGQVWSHGLELREENDLTI